MKVTLVKKSGLPLLLFLIEEVIFAFLGNNYNSEMVKTLGIVSIFIIIILVLIEIKTFDNNGLYLMFLIFFFAFTLGKVMVFAVDPSALDIDLTYRGRFSYTDIVRAVKFSLRSIIFLEFGRILSYKQQDTDAIIDRSEIEPWDGDFLIRIGTILCVIGIPLDILNLIPTVIQIIRFGYISAYYADYFQTSTAIQSIAQYFLIGTYFCAMGRAVKGKSIISASYIYLLIKALIYFFIGKRGQGLILLLPFVWFYYYVRNNYGHENTKKRLSIGKILLVVLAALLFTSASNAIADVRNSSFVGFSEILSLTVQNFVEMRSITDTLVELGGSIRPLLEVIKFTDSGAMTFNYGLSYLFSVFGIIPSAIRGPIQTLGLSLGAVNLTSVLEGLTGLNYGIGYSLCAEAYYNFAYAGFIVFAFIGYFVSRLYQPSRQKTVMLSLAQVCLVVVMCTLTLTTVRGTSALYIKNFFYYYFVPMFFLKRYAGGTQKR